MIRTIAANNCLIYFQIFIHERNLLIKRWFGLLKRRGRFCWLRFQFYRLFLLLNSNIFLNYFYYLLYSLHIGLWLRLNSSFLFNLLFLWGFWGFDIALNFNLRHSQIAKSFFQYILNLQSFFFLWLHKNSFTGKDGQ